MTNPNSKEPLRVALVGAGGLGRAWNGAINKHPEVELAAVVDPLIGTDKQAEWIDTETGDVPRSTDISATGGLALDAAVITAFSTAHFDAVSKALERGLHVLVEKPFATSMQDAEKLVDLAAQKDLTLMVSQNYRYFPGSKTLRGIVQSGKYGKVTAVFGEFWCDWPGKPYQHGMDHVMGLEMAIHHFDMVRAIFDAEPASGHVREWQPAKCQYKSGGGIDALFDMKGNDQDFPFTYSGSLVGKAPRTPWPGNWRIEFDTETLVVDTVDDRYGIYRAHEGGFEWIGELNGPDMAFEMPLGHFRDCIANGAEPWSSGRDNLGTLGMALGAEIFGQS